MWFTVPNLKQLYCLAHLAAPRVRNLGYMFGFRSHIMRFIVKLIIYKRINMQCDDEGLGPRSELDISFRVAVGQLAHLIVPASLISGDFQLPTTLSYFSLTVT